MEASEDNDLCKHIEKSVNLNLLEELVSKQLSANTKCLESTCQFAETDLTKWDNRTVWVCLACCGPYCSRYYKAHGIIHYSMFPSHSVLLSLDTLDVWCYTCEKYVFPNQAIAQAQAIIQKRFKNEIGQAFLTTPGLTNLKRSCFLNAFNSLMHVIVGTSVLHDILIPSNPYHDPPHIDATKYITAVTNEVGPLTDLFKEFLHKMWQARDDIIDPSDLSNKIANKWPQFLDNVRGRNDGQELMRLLFDEIKSEELEFIKKYSQMKDHKEKKNYSPFIDACFSGKLVNVMTCSMCKHCLYSYEEFSYISSPLPYYLSFRLKTLRHYLESFMKVKGDDRNFSCDNCWKLKTKLNLGIDVTVDNSSDTDNENSYMMERQHILNKASKRYLFDSLPSVMVFHLQKHSSWIGKLYEEELDVGDFIIPGKIEKENDGYIVDNKAQSLPKQNNQRKFSTKYRLYGVILCDNIYGRYASYVLSRNVRDKEQRKWIYYCDNCIKAATIEEVLSSKAYLLFYERVYE